jgi:hypothetical protein
MAPHTLNKPEYLVDSACASADADGFPEYQAVEPILDNAVGPLGRHADTFPKRARREKRVCDFPVSNEFHFLKQ